MLVQPMNNPIHLTLMTKIFTNLCGIRYKMVAMTSIFKFLDVKIVGLMRVVWKYWTKNERKWRFFFVQLLVKAIISLCNSVFLFLRSLWIKFSTFAKLHESSIFDYVLPFLVRWYDPYIHWKKRLQRIIFTWIRGCQI